MSINKVNKLTGSLTQLAGKGRAEYGASTTRHASFSIPAQTADTMLTQLVTFATPMPDANYEVALSTATSAFALSIGQKSATGFTLNIYVLATTSEAQPVDYTAFKLYTDTEYNELLDYKTYVRAQTRLSALESVTLSTNAATPTIAEYDGYLMLDYYVISNNGTGTRTFHINDVTIYLQSVSQYAISRHDLATFPVCKGDEIYIDSFGSNMQAWFRYYKDRDYS